MSPWPRVWAAGCRSAPIGLGEAGTALRKGDHGSTFGGNPVACAAALAVLDTIEADGLLDQAAEVGQQLRTVAPLSHPLLRGVRGRASGSPALDRALRGPGRGGRQGRRIPGERRQPDAVRLAPPLILSEDEVGVFLAAWPGILEASARQAGQSRPGSRPDMPRHVRRA